jgi:cell fate regulator YaaT (PSP1 superfamily)
MLAYPSKMEACPSKMHVCLNKIKNHTIEMFYLNINSINLLTNKLNIYYL